MVEFDFVYRLKMRPTSINQSCLILILCWLSHVCNALDGLTPGQFLSGNQTLSSPNNTFQLGFFSPGQTGRFYIGIWYTVSLPEKVVVWVANRDQPVSDPTFCKFLLLQDGNLVLVNQSDSQIWATDSIPGVNFNSTQVVLLDSGNLVVRDAVDPYYRPMWQSFDHPTDHWLPGGKVGHNKVTGLKQTLRPWRSKNNPAPNMFSVEVEANGTSHVLLWNETRLYWSTGEWDGKVFQSIPEIALNFYIKNLTYVDNVNESYFTYEPGVPGALTRFLMDSTGQLKQYVWGRNFTSWTIFWTRPSQQCDVYAFCGAFSSCNNVQTPLCTCLPGFEPRNPKNWGEEDRTEGCKRKLPLQCDDESGGNGSTTFVVVSRIRFPPDSVTLPMGNGEDCRMACLSNCTCTAQAFDGGRCYHWIGELYKVVQVQSDDTTGKDIYVKLSGSDQVEASHKGESKTNTKWIIVGASSGCLVLVLLVVIVILLIVRKSRARTRSLEPLDDTLMVFKYRDLRAATNNFSEKLGEGGFGFVYKGTLGNSNAIAVKRLKTLNQGSNQEKQFRAEVSTIGTIQHINLARLRGLCTKGSTRFLVFDYMENGSLEQKLFSRDAGVIDWNTRYKIAIGIARGLAYLHEKCRDCIIHCDIKPENILLDAELNPKITDFGLSKLVGREFSRVLTTLRGTRGYLAPEWISGEPITAKADVFSYGMLLLEIVSGRRNTDVNVDDHDSGGFFPASVAKSIWMGEGVMSLVDARSEGNIDEEEVGRVCKVACWCIQEEESIRPSMGHVVQILEGLISQVPVFPVPQFLKGFAVDEEDDTEPIAFVISSSMTSSAALSS